LISPPYPVAAYSIAWSDVVDLAAKNQPRERAPQQLSECLQGALHTGQFVSGGRNANLIEASSTSLNVLNAWA
jgi:hypothetical protein